MSAISSLNLWRKFPYHFWYTTSKSCDIIHQALRSKWEFKKDEALHSTQSFRTELFFPFHFFFLFFFLFLFLQCGGVWASREKDNPAVRGKRKINIFWFCLAFQTSQALERVSSFQWNSFISQYKHPSGGCCHWFLFLNWGLIQLPLKPAGFFLLFYSGPLGPLVAEKQLCPRELACLN